MPLRIKKLNVYPKFPCASDIIIKISETEEDKNIYDKLIFIPCEWNQSYFPRESLSRYGENVKRTGELAEKRSHIFP